MTVFYRDWVNLGSDDVYRCAVYSKADGWYLFVVVEIRDRRWSQELELGPTRDGGL